MKTEDQPIIYQASNGAIALRQDAKSDTIWATQAQMATIFEKDQSVISRHIKNIFKDGEVDLKSNMQNMHIANSDKPVSYYSLDVILSVGYRTNSFRAIDFRKWATKILKAYISDGFAIDKKRVAKHYAKFSEAVEAIKALSLGKESQISHDITMDLVGEFAYTWLSLDAYDKKSLPQKGLTKESVKFTAQDLTSAIAKLKAEGLAREVIRVVQAARKKAGLNVDDRINLSLSTEDTKLKNAIEQFKHEIAKETLAESVDYDSTYVYQEDVKIDNEELSLSLEKK